LAAFPTNYQNMKRYFSKNERETIGLAKKIAGRLKGGEVLLLQGELGAGKTTFVKGLAQAFGIKERITSPTFVLMHQHRIKDKGLRIKYFVHCDAYRVKSARELGDVGLIDWLGKPDTLVVVEWGEKIKPLLRGKKYTTIKFQHGKKENERIITIRA